MDNPTCEWVRGRLPLCLGAGDDVDPPNAEGGDLSVRDRRSIEGHLGTCPACREHRSGLTRALKALGVAAAALPAVPDAPSLWPALELRIAAYRSRDRSRTSKARAKVHTHARARGGAAERERTGAGVVGDRSQRSGGTGHRSTAGREVAGPDARSGRRAGTARPGGSVRVLLGSARIMGASLAASVLAMLVVVPSWRRQADAEAVMHANATPLAGLIRPPGRPQPEPPARVPDETQAEADRGIPAGEIAQADPVRTPAEPSPAADAAPAARTAAPTRFGYDLEHGTPMPPDGRDAKPVY